jgi:hypothetical protein
MIDWYSVGFSALWIFGLGLLTSTLSMFTYLAGEKKWRLRQLFETSAFRVMIYLGLELFCIGWAGSVVVTWERIVWGVLALIFAVKIWQDRKLSRA